MGLDQHLQEQETHGVNERASLHVAPLVPKHPRYQECPKGMADEVPLLETPDLQHVDHVRRKLPRARDVVREAHGDGGHVHEEERVLLPHALHQQLEEGQAHRRPDPYAVAEDHGLQPVLVLVRPSADAAIPPGLSRMWRPEPVLRAAGAVGPEAKAQEGAVANHRAHKSREGVDEEWAVYSWKWIIPQAEAPEGVVLATHGLLGT
mmetsp:Transcript_102544/g.299132  ORF Transcript_102544/g.299132 Transcript_102544/m.299132 type:complete len:206 (-) Transcript_102544:990-1607(-)